MSNGIEDTINLDGIIRDIHALENSSVKVGLDPSLSTDVLQLAAASEFGSKVSVTNTIRNFLKQNNVPLQKDTTSLEMPEQSLLRNAFDKEEFQNKIQDELEEGLNGLISESSSANQIWKRIGEKASEETKKSTANQTIPFIEISDTQKENQNSIIQFLKSKSLFENINYEVIK